jgi:hypothetical protein
VAVPEAAAVLAEQWAQVLAELDGTGRAQLRTLSDRFTTATAGELTGIWGKVIDLVRRELPLGSPVRVELEQALAKDRFGTGRGQATLPRPPGVAAPAKPTIHKWLRAAPTFSPAAVRRRGVDPGLPGLIRIRKPDGLIFLPSFQFTRTGDPKPLVLRINRLLDADTDPLGAADWWLCPNVWLPGTPADLLDVLDEHVLVAAAVVAVEG